VAGHVGLELRNVVANYPFESSRGFPGSGPNSGQGDHSRLSCKAGDTQLGGWVLPGSSVSVLHGRPHGVAEKALNYGAASDGGYKIVDCDSAGLLFGCRDIHGRSWRASSEAAKLLHWA
jgi:hypothetical protein